MHILSRMWEALRPHEAAAPPTDQSVDDAITQSRAARAMMDENIRLRMHDVETFRAEQQTIRDNILEQVMLGNRLSDRHGKRR